MKLEDWVRTGDEGTTACIWTCEACGWVGVPEGEEPEPCPECGEDARYLALLCLMERPEPVCCVAPERVACGGCGRAWCERCDPAPSALCHWCHGRGHSTAPL